MKRIVAVFTDKLDQIKRDRKMKKQEEMLSKIWSIVYWLNWL